MKKYINNLVFKLPSILIILSTVVISCEEYDPSDGIKDVSLKATANRTLITAGESITYIDSSLNAASRVWTFQGGKITTSDQEKVSVTYENPSEIGDDDTPVGFTTTLEITNADGIVESNGFKIDVYAKVKPDFSANLTTAITNSMVKFTNESEFTESKFDDAKEKDSLVWQFPGGKPNRSVEKNPIVLYDTPGTYEITLLVHREGPKSIASIEKTAYINIVEELALVPAFTSDVTEISEEQSVTFEDTSTGGADIWKWTFPGGTPETSSDQNPVIKYDSGGFYDVTLEVTRIADGTKETSTETGYVFVDSPFCNTPENLIGCGNNDGENERLTDWSAEIEPDKLTPVDRNDRLSVSAEQAFAGSGSIKYAYSEPGAAPFTGVLLDYNGKMIEVTEAGNYTISMEHYGVITGGTEYVFFFGVVNSETEVYTSNFRGRFQAGQWNNTTDVLELQPGKYFIRTQLFNPGFNPTQSIDLYMDDLKIVKN